MADIFVHSADGNDTTGDGSSSTPYKTMEKAFTEASASDTIYPIANSTAYTLADDTIPSNITITAIAEDLTTTPYIQNPIVEHVVFDGNSDQKIWQLTDSITMNNIILKDWQSVSGQKTSFIKTCLTTSSINASVILNKCEFRNIIIDGSTATRGGFIGNGATYGYNYTDLTVRFNQCIFNNIKLTTDAYYYALVRADGTVNVYTENCSWYADATGIGVQTFANQGTFTGNLNVVSHKNLAIKNLNSKTLDLGNGVTESTAGLLYTGNITQTANTTNVVNADPQFADVANNIFHPDVDSPAIRGGSAL